MKLQIERALFEQLLAAFPELEPYAAQLNFGQRVEVSASRLSVAQLETLEGYYRAENAPARAGQLAMLREALHGEGVQFQEGELEQVLPHLANCLLEQPIHGWLFEANSSGRPLPWLVTRIDYSPAAEEESGRILLELKANALARIVSRNVVIRERDIIDRTAAQILADKGLFRETSQLMEIYDAAADRYFDWRSQYGEQFSAQGVGVYAEDPTASHRQNDWTRKSRVILSSSGSQARLVNDEDILSERALTVDVGGDILAKYLRKAGRSMNYDEKVEAATAAARERMPAGLFTEVPVHAYVLMFHLELHHHVWVHVDDMMPYVYQPELKDKLVLPTEQTDLIDILTAEMDLLMDDIVEGKSGGTTVLCAGPAGVGKTLTAEVYAEIIRRPLYRVHSGQLGLNVSEMEKALKDTLTRAQRWGAVMLIDEADVYIKRRDDNIAANAVVGVFLRVLEYFNGLLFLTTNRVGDIDEAIVSRCIAMITYRPPDLAERERIWDVMVNQFGLPVSAELQAQLAQRFPEATGRDIKGLAKLVAKYCQYKQVPPTLPVFERCSVFRGLQL